MKKEKRGMTTLAESILSKYVTIQDNRATVDFYFDSVAELIDQTFGDERVEKLNSTLYSKMNELFVILPMKYEIFVNLHFKEFGEYTIEETEKIIQENMLLMMYEHILERRRKRITAFSLLGGGVVMLLISYFLNIPKVPEIITNVINISGTLFVWEAANVGLIKRTEQTKLAKRYIKKFKGMKVLAN